MKILVTAGGTFMPIDDVRGIDNIFNGRTGIDIGHHMSYHHNDNIVNLLLQKKSRWVEYMLNETPMGFSGSILHDAPHGYRLFHTYDDLYKQMEVEITKGNYDVIIHSAAVSDYKVDGIYTNNIHTIGSPENISAPYLDRLPDVGKQKSNHKELFLRLVQTEKIVDKIRNDWGFQGTLIKFKLEVGISDEELLTIAKKSRVDSKADIMVANCLEWAKERAYVVTEDSVTNIQRDLLPHYLYGEICRNV